MTTPLPTQPELIKSLSEALIESTTWFDGKPHLSPDQEELIQLGRMMEEMANAPKEEYGKRTPGERGMYEIQRSLENFSE